MDFWYYSDKRHVVGRLADEKTAVTWAHARIPGVIVFEAPEEFVRDNVDVADNKLTGNLHNWSF